MCLGTRPEAIKLAPVIRELAARRDRFATRVVVTAQHRGMLDQVLEVFGVSPDVDLNLMRPGQTLTRVTTRVLERLAGLLDAERPDLLVVQGDTTTAFASALAAFYRRLPVAHVEAGLRTGDRFAPFPEELNRRLIAVVADYHFAPTDWTSGNLIREGVPRNRIWVTGNTVVDALRSVLPAARARPPAVVERLDSGRRLILVTAHRRESFGPGLRSICRALTQIAHRNRDVEIVYPVHLNPQVRGPVRALLSGRERIHLLRPLDYLSFVNLMDRAYLILSDSGGIQEEAPALGRPVLVMRDKTERPEAIRAGTARLVGTRPTTILHMTERLLGSAATHRRMARATNPFGDGRAAKRIVRVLIKRGPTAGGGS